MELPSIFTIWRPSYIIRPRPLWLVICYQREFCRIKKYIIISVNHIDLLGQKLNAMVIDFSQLYTSFSKPTMLNKSIYIFKRETKTNEVASLKLSIGVLVDYGWIWDIPHWWEVESWSRVVCINKKHMLSLCQLMDDKS